MKILSAISDFLHADRQIFTTFNCQSAKSQFTSLISYSPLFFTVAYELSYVSVTRQSYTQNSILFPSFNVSLPIKIFAHFFVTSCSVVSMSLTLTNNMCSKHFCYVQFHKGRKKDVSFVDEILLGGVECDCSVLCTCF